MLFNTLNTIVYYQQSADAHIQQLLANTAPLCRHDHCSGHLPYDYQRDEKPLPLLGETTNEHRCVFSGWHLDIKRRCKYG